MGHMAAGHCQWCHGWYMWVLLLLLCSSEVSEFPTKPFYASRSSCQLPPEQKREIRGVGIQRVSCSELMASHGMVEAEWRSLGRGEAAQPAVGAMVEEAGCVSSLQGEGSEITQASWILNPRYLFGRGSEGFSILQGLQMRVGLLPSNRMGLCRMAPL